MFAVVVGPVGVAFCPVGRELVDPELGTATRAAESELVERSGTKACTTTRGSSTSQIKMRQTSRKAVNVNNYFSFQVLLARNFSSRL